MNRVPTEEGEMLPCPHCGGQDIRIHEHPGAGTGWQHHGETVYSMCCHDCGATFPNRYRKQLLIDAWNKRARPKDGKMSMLKIEKLLADLHAEIWEAAERSGQYDLAGIDIAKELLSKIRPIDEPIDMILFCPKCGTQHIDEPEKPSVRGGHGVDIIVKHAWDNPPHRSHLCQNPICKFIWRPADVPTNGVAAIKTIGKMDNLLPQKAKK